jgi:hypothetical protein
VRVVVERLQSIEAALDSIDLSGDGGDVHAVRHTRTPSGVVRHVNFAPNSLPALVACGQALFIVTPIKNESPTAIPAHGYLDLSFLRGGSGMPLSICIRYAAS